MLSEYLSGSLNGTRQQTIPYRSPNEQLDFWSDFRWNPDRPEEFFHAVIQRVNRLHDPRYMGHQVSAPVPVAALSVFVGALLNNGNAVYEMGMPVAAMERWVCDFMARQFSFPEGARGFLTSGGTLANLTALLTARQVMLPYDVWNEGLQEPLGIMVSEQAHYCVDRAARIMGLGALGLVRVPVNAQYGIDTDALEESYRKASARGVRIFALVGSAPSTSTGNYDDLKALSAFARDKGIWFHIDAAHGGAAIFSEKYKSVLDGAERADSIIIDGHKMMLMPSLTTMVLYREGAHSHATFRQQADYLFGEEEQEDWFNLARRTFECTKTMMALPWYVLLRGYGPALFDIYVSRQYDLAVEFADLIRSRPHWEVATEPMSNILCFRYLPRSVRVEELDSVQQWLRRQILEAGVYYLVETRLKGALWLRVSLMNPFTGMEHLLSLLEHCEQQFVGAQ